MYVQNLNMSASCSLRAVAGHSFGPQRLNISSEALLRLKSLSFTTLLVALKSSFLSGMYVRVVWIDGKSATESSRRL
jgi:hypothetical protein